MKRNYLKMGWILAMVVLLAGMGTVAFADWGMGYGRHHMGYGPGGQGSGCGYGPGPGWHHRGWGSGDEDLSAEEVKKFREERDAFQEATRDLREDLHQKRLELESELAKKDPDGAKAASIQKEISDLRAQLDQKRIEHRIKMEKLSPDGNFRRGPGFYGKKGPRGGGGPGACWY